MTEKMRMVLNLFFNDLHELFVKFTLNPLYIDGDPIKSSSFNDRVLILARKYL